MKVWVTRKSCGNTRRKQVSKRTLVTSWIQNSPLHLEILTYRQHLHCFCFYTGRVTSDTRKATQRKTKKLTFSLAAMCDTSRPHSNFFFRLRRIKTYLDGKILFLCHQTIALCCTLNFFHVKMDGITAFRSKSAAVCFWNSFSKSVWIRNPT